MSQIAATPHDLPRGHSHAKADFSPANTTWSGGPISGALLLVGIVGLLATIAGGVAVSPKHALAAWLVGSMTCLAMGLGCMFWVMAFHLTQAGWSATIRRQFENAMILVPVAAAMVVAVPVIEALFTGGQLYVWLNEAISGGDVLLTEKSTYLNPLFFLLRAAIYLSAWTFLAWRLRSYSVEQDRTGDKWITNRARFTSSWGMLVFALTVAFAAFDWLMSLDYRFFSTMWGVYFFAGAAFSSVPLMVLVFSRLRAAGKLDGLVTEEHLHDLAKLMFGFTVFWAYIAFSQYFLIWYANIPEETSFMLARKVDGWQYLSMFLVIGHFILPFYILLWRAVRRSFALLSIMALWAIFMQVADLMWVVRPFVYYLNETDKIQLGRAWLDIAGVIGPLGIFLGLLVRQIGSGPLIPLHDPRLPEALHHKNYV